MGRLRRRKKLKEGKIIRGAASSGHKRRAGDVSNFDAERDLLSHDWRKAKRNSVSRPRSVMCLKNPAKKFKSSVWKGGAPNIRAKQGSLARLGAEWRETLSGDLLERGKGRGIYHPVPLHRSVNET